MPGVCGLLLPLAGCCCPLLVGGSRTWGGLYPGPGLDVNGGLGPMDIAYWVGDCERDDDCISERR